jgi:putative hydrolase of the HAD superfamily
MSRRLPKVILFDLGNVLVRFDHRIAARRILPFSGKDFNEILQLFFDSPVTKDFEEGRVSPRSYYKKISRVLELKNMTFEKFVSIWNEIFFDNRGMASLLRELKKQYRLCLISNINELHYLYIAKKFPRLFGFFDRIVLSYEVGKRKPAVLIYRRAIQDAGYAPEEVLYTDDRRDLIEEARKMGIPSIVFKGVADFKCRLKKWGILG